MCDYLLAIVLKKILISSNKYELVSLLESDKQLIPMTLRYLDGVTEVELQLKRMICVICTPPFQIIERILRLQLYSQHSIVDEVFQWWGEPTYLKLSLAVCIRMVINSCKVWNSDRQEELKLNNSSSADTSYFYWERDSYFRYL